MAGGGEQLRVLLPELIGSQNTWSQLGAHARRRRPKPRPKQKQEKRKETRDDEALSLERVI